MATSLQQFMDAIFYRLEEGHFIEIRGIAPSWAKIDPPIRRRYAQSTQDAVDIILSMKLLGPYGIYFGVLPRNGRGGSKSYVDGGWTAYVDIDEKSFSASWQAEEALQKGIRELGEDPMCVVHSGHGLHAYWRLSRFHESHEIEAINKMISNVCMGDHTTDCTRIFRSPFTVNNKNKGALELCTILDFDPNRVATSLVQIAHSSGPVLHGGGTDLSPCPFSLNELSPMWRRYILDGIAADQRGYYQGDRSALDSAVTKEMVLAGFSDDQIFTVFTDPSLGISEKALEKGSHAKTYIQRTIANSRNYVDKLRVRF